MIKIPENIVDLALKKHYNGVNHWISKSLEFYINIFDFVINNKNINIKKSISVHYGGINGRSLNALASVIFDEDAITNKALINYLKGEHKFTLKTKINSKKTLSL